MLFDTHAHYDDERFDEDRDALVDFSDPYYTDVPPQIVTLKDNAASYTTLLGQ